MTPEETKEYEQHVANCKDLFAQLIPIIDKHQPGTIMHVLCNILGNICAGLPEELPEQLANLDLAITHFHTLSKHHLDNMDKPT
ncbi:hypothetical protein UFOVP816_26 [uncultured Caudovirales phage]|uniref:Uncharacterized protein n=1 Tax=uncultured Caudovirales phage TaxID=2100421 RepID=A0A6J5NZ58_9CAUD|nr:hypothetical protein UFOVP816_26 [uncultured Caudovirales phage]